jgi:hypothetical protein
MKLSVPSTLDPVVSRLPWGFRRQVRHLLEGPARLGHELRWRVRSQDEIERWISERLALDGYYWLFVLGLNNSGTTMLADILGRHPRIRTLPEEGQWLTRVFPLSKDLGTPRAYTKRLDVFRWEEDHDPAPALRARYDWALYYDRRPGALLEKSTPHSLRSRWIQRNFRPARFVTITRDPFAVCEGIRRRSGQSIEDAARHWTIGHEILLEDMPHLERCLLLTYEQLCDDLGATLERLESFLDLETPFDRASLSRPMRAPIAGGVQEAVRSQNAWSVSRLTAAEIETITRIAGPVMARLGYSCP